MRKKLCLRESEEVCLCFAMGLASSLMSDDNIGNVGGFMRNGRFESLVSRCHFTALFTACSFS